MESQDLYSDMDWKEFRWIRLLIRVILNKEERKV